VGKLSANSNGELNCMSDITFASPNSYK